MSRHRSRSEEHTSELQSRRDLVCRLLLEKKKNLAGRQRAFDNLRICSIVGWRKMSIVRTASFGLCWSCSFVFFNDTATTEIYTLSLHDALPISFARSEVAPLLSLPTSALFMSCRTQDRKSTRLNSSHPSISYAVFCFKKKNYDSLSSRSVSSSSSTPLSASVSLAS